MPVNRNALIRYKTLDKCLQNRFKQWTLEDLIDACSDALYEYEGIDKGVSKRTVQADIQVMRSDKLGYNAPIIVIDKRYYTYEDADYSITNIPLSTQDLGMLSEAVEFMKQFQGFSHFRGLDGMVQKLEDHIYSQKTSTRSVIDFEKNENLKGLEHLDTLYQSIIQRKVIEITYQSFKARQANSFRFRPYLLKEFRNRWFLIGRRKKRSPVVTLALDRIHSMKHSNDVYLEDEVFDSDWHFSDVIGVSVSENVEAEDIQLFFTHQHAPYVITKPLHHSQRTIHKDAHGLIIGLTVQHNFELEKEILGFGEGVNVLSPASLRRRIKTRVEGAVDNYNTELSVKGLNRAMMTLTQRGSSVLNHIYSRRELRKIGTQVDQYVTKSSKKSAGIRQLLKEIPTLENLLFNKNLKRIISKIDPNAFLVKATLFEKSKDVNWFVSWHQDIMINVDKKRNLRGYRAWTESDGVTKVLPPLDISKSMFSIRVHLNDTDAKNGALEVVPGSHKKQLSPEEITLITENCSPSLCEVGAGGVHVFRPLTLHRSGRITKQKKRRVIQLEFSSVELAKGVDWLEKKDIK